MSLRPGATVHFVGIGGAGMSAIAKVLLEQGATVSGSDLKQSRAATMLEIMGARVTLGHDPSNVPDGAVVIVSSAIPESNPELRRARELGYTILTRGEALADLLQNKRSVVVAGTHGKTTTTSMIVTVLRSSGRDPTYLVGGGLNDVGTNAKHGRGDLAVAESDESDGSFLLLRPHVAVVTNVEIDHVDYWHSLGEMHDGFERFMSATDEDGAIVVPAEDPELMRRAHSSGRRVVDFGERGTVGVAKLRLDGDGCSFLLTVREAAEWGEWTGNVHLRVPGAHNVSNALAAAAACLLVGVPPEDVAFGLGQYRGVERRWQMRGRANGVTVVDDYAHHPTEVRATLAAARRGEWERVVAVFQPHRYSRTAAFAGEFARSFGAADRIVITDIYGAGELPVPGVNGKAIADGVCVQLPGRPVAYLPHRLELLTYLERSVRPGDLILTLGAGDVSSVGEELLGRLKAVR